jgi:hypothetical protein
MMADQNLDIVPIRFNPKDQQRLRRALDPDKKIATQLKELIFQQIEGAEVRSPEKSPPDNARLEALFRERLDKITSLLSMLVERLDEQDAKLSSIGGDAARSRLVVENIQDYLSEDSRGEGDASS